MGRGPGRVSVNRASDDSNLLEVSSRPCSPHPLLWPVPIWSGCGWKFSWSVPVPLTPWLPLTCRPRLGSTIPRPLSLPTTWTQPCHFPAQWSSAAHMGGPRVWRRTHSQGAEKWASFQTTPLIGPVPGRPVTELQSGLGWHAGSWLQLSSPHETAALLNYCDARPATAGGRPS